jgi:hypothetical protein
MPVEGAVPPFLVTSFNGQGRQPFVVAKFLPYLEQQQQLQLQPRSEIITRLSERANFRAWSLTFQLSTFSRLPLWNGSVEKGAGATLKVNKPCSAIDIPQRSGTRGSGCYHVHTLHDTTATL